MKQSKPRNYIALALMKRGGDGAHVKTNKAKRATAKQQLAKELKKPSDNYSGGFLNSFLSEYANFFHIPLRIWCDTKTKLTVQRLSIVSS